MVAVTVFVPFSPSSRGNHLFGYLASRACPAV